MPKFHYTKIVGYIIPFKIDLPIQKYLAIKMKNSLLVFLLFISSVLFATPEITSKYYSTKNVDIEVFIRYENDVQDLYYKSLIENLNIYVQSLKDIGKLESGKVRFEIMTAHWMEHAHGVESFKSPNGYYCFINGLVQPITQDYLLSIINYFSSDEWESFCYNHQKISPKKALKVFNRKLEHITVNQIFEPIRVLTLNHLIVDFKEGKLICMIGGKEFGEIDNISPFSQGTRDFFMSGFVIYAVEKGKVVSSVDVPKGYIGYEWRTEVYKKWVNFSCHRDYLASYFSDKECFYKLIE